MTCKQVYIEKCTSYDTEKIYHIILSSFKKLNFSIRKGSNVLLKPNLLTNATPNDAITTHPTVIEAICKYLTSKKCRIFIGDSSGSVKKNSTMLAFQQSGIAKIAKKYNASIIVFERSKMKKTRIKNTVVKQVNVAELLLTVDYVINIPKMKTHSLMLFTGAVKNTYGYIPGSKKQEFHSIASSPDKFAKLLSAIHKIREPDINIMDGILALEGNGPGKGGIPKKTDLILISKNAYALDKAACNILGIKGVKTNLLNNVQPKIINFIPKQIKFKKSNTTWITSNPMLGWLIGIVMKYLPKKPYFNIKKCTRCYECYNGCPQKAIILDQQKYPQLIRNKCISCFYCHEVCNFNSIKLKRF